ncbi:PrsW family intramembrane metalloprotease [Kitasatospora sp. NBC_01287]|uniref:PrsW family intramembrane metalloprotease n=1 Tax=Kitasatospora sp. NBC_01287 TaxID=2903573 RepID=UPI0022565AFB|nr:PrsW family intramembrane metalloprotease [Kitasatospora sp. NBC_01287]MCX4747448.1 PrsW family intramembrane metalloprotease [Kitasatospora sp. NBC_01287]
MSSPSRPRSAGPTATGLVLAASAVLLVHLVQAQTGTTGLLVGLGLAVLPLPFVLAALTWLNQSARVPARRLALCLVWGSCAAATIAMLANGWASDTLTALQGSSRGETLGAEFASPLIEESAKGAVLLLTMAPPLRRWARAARLAPTPPARARLRHRAVATGLVLSGFSACGFAFAENVLYLGRAFTDDQRQRLDAIGLGLSPSLRDYDDTVRTFVLRALLSPFAHPLFTALTGLGLAVALTSRRRWPARLAAPLGLLAAVALHGAWNAAAGLGTHGFLLVYAALMVPCFAALTGLALWAGARPGPGVR